jgi:hypothetical protein
MGLTNEQIDRLYASRRVKGEYERLLVELTASDENGADVKATWPNLSTKSVTTLTQGFRSAATKLEIADQVDIISADSNVYIILTDRVHVEASTNGKK